MLKKLIFGTMFLLAFNFMATAQDPWITKAYQKLYGRNPNNNAYEWDKNNYNGGKWSSYCELVGHIVMYNNRKNGIKTDPWIYRAYCELYNEKVPTGNELTTTNYNGGQWANYDVLKNAIQNYNSPKTTTPSNPVANFPAATFAWSEFDQYNAVRTESYNLSNGNTFLVFIENNTATSALLNNGNWNVVEKFEMVAAGGGNMVAAGGGNLKIYLKGGSNITVSWPPNLVAAGGGNLVAAGGGNLVAAGGGNVLSKVATIIAAGDRMLFSTPPAGEKVVKTKGGNFKLKSK